MQDDDYEYDAEYEALIGKGKKDGDESGSDDEEVKEEVEGDHEVEVEYD